jgi:hypothetical protein
MRACCLLTLLPVGSPVVTLRGSERCNFAAAGREEAVDENGKPIKKEEPKSWLEKNWMMVIFGGMLVCRLGHVDISNTAPGLVNVSRKCLMTLSQHSSLPMLPFVCVHNIYCALGDELVGERSNGRRRTATGWRSQRTSSLKECKSLNNWKFRETKA